MSSKNYLVNGSTAVISGALGCYNEKLQQRVQNHQILWHPLMGYGSDVAAGAVYTALFLMYYHFKEQKHNTKLLDWTAPLAATALCTFGEFTGIMGDTFDPGDIAAYCTGAGLAFLVHKVFSEKIPQDIYNNHNLK